LIVATQVHIVELEIHDLFDAVAKLAAGGLCRRGAGKEERNERACGAKGNSVHRASLRLKIDEILRSTECSHEILGAECNGTRSDGLQIYVVAFAVS
jgi:hypothetical protein